MWVGTYLLVLVASTALMYFPEGMRGVSEDLTGVLYSVFSAARDPHRLRDAAVCEEMINRASSFIRWAGSRNVTRF
jgi:hypothetical protein